MLGQRLVAGLAALACLGGPPALAGGRPPVSTIHYSITRDQVWVTVGGNGSSRSYVITERALQVIGNGSAVIARRNSTGARLVGTAREGAGLPDPDLVRAMLIDRVVLADVRAKRPVEAPAMSVVEDAIALVDQWESRNQQERAAELDRLLTSVAGATAADALGVVRVRCDREAIARTLASDADSTTSEEGEL